MVSTIYVGSQCFWETHPRTFIITIFIMQKKKKTVIFVINRISSNLAPVSLQFVFNDYTTSREGGEITVIYMNSFRITLETHHAKNTETNDTSRRTKTERCPSPLVTPEDQISHLSSA